VKCYTVFPVSSKKQPFFPPAHYQYVEAFSNSLGHFKFPRKMRKKGVLWRSLRILLARRMTRQIDYHPTVERQATDRRAPEYIKRDNMLSVLDFVSDTNSIKFLVR